MSRPFLKWAGGKSQLLRQFEQLFPQSFKRYYEPFVGSAAVFFHLRSTDRSADARLSDSNSELIDCYKAVRDCRPRLCRKLAIHGMQHSTDYYYMIRNTGPNRLGFAARAARTIYLNKTCFNGLYRVNKSGKFNVPIGKYTNPPILNIKLLTSASIALQGVGLEVADFRKLPTMVQKGDFVYIDPPYQPSSLTSYFTSYTSSDFGENDQRDLVFTVKQLSALGASVMVSNSETQFVRDLYKDFQIHRVTTSRAINSNPKKRGQTPEVVMTNYTPNS